MKAGWQEGYYMRRYIVFAVLFIMLIVTGFEENMKTGNGISSNETTIGANGQHLSGCDE
jgi:hypothetical protein